MTPDRPGLFEELKRRHVWRVAAAYAVAGWLIVQIATQVFPFFSVPGWVVRLVVLALVLGFPVAVAFAWIYELTPEGVRRTEPAGSPAARTEPTQLQIGRKLNASIVALLVLAIALLGWRLYAVRHTRVAAPAGGVGMVPARTAHPVGWADASPSAAAAVSGLRTTANAATPAPAGSIPGKSVAVLPFANESGRQGERFFSDGLSDDLITALSQFAGLKVISRNSAFQFRDSKDSSAEIGKLLGVAHLLEGSVQRSQDEVRITATLVNATDGSVLWSQRYDKPYKDLFALQDDITHSVADALKAKLLTAPGAVVQSDRPPSGNLAAWQAYQQGRFYEAHFTQSGYRKAINDYTEATRLDPRYAAAYAQMSDGWIGLAIQYLAGAAKEQAYATARRAIGTALQLAPDSALAHAARGDLLRLSDYDWGGAQAEYQRAAQLAPNNPDVLASLASMEAAQGRAHSAVELTRKALAGDPLNAAGYVYLGEYLAGLGRFAAAQEAVEKAVELQPGADSVHEQLAVVAIFRGDAKAALAAAHQEHAPGWRRVALALATQIGSDRKAADTALATLIAHDTEAAPFQIAEVYALRGDPDNMFKWLDRAWASRDPGISYLLYDPFILRYRGDPRFKAFCKTVGLPTTTDAVAMK